MLDNNPKRRRLTPLNAPFRSPLHRQSTPILLNASTPTSTPSTPTASTLRNTSSRTTAYTTPVRKLPPRQFKSPILSRNEEEGLTPEILALVHRKRELEAQIREEKRALENVELALKYEKQVHITYKSLV